MERLFLLSSLRVVTELLQPLCRDVYLLALGGACANMISVFLLFHIAHTNHMLQNI